MIEEIKKLEEEKTILLQKLQQIEQTKNELLTKIIEIQGIIKYLTNSENKGRKNITN